MANNTIINGGAKPNPVHVGPTPICSFSDGALDAPLKSLKFYIAPSQDLHGYSYPWPAGGGVNKLPTLTAATTLAMVTWTPNSDGSISVSGTASGSNSVLDLGRNVLTLPAGTYRTNVSGEVTNLQVTVFKNVGGSASAIAQGGGVFTLTDETSVFVRFLFPNGSSASGKIYPQITAGSAVTPYSPYSNICPISGWSQVDGKQSGEDMTDYTPITISLGQTVYGGTVDALSGSGTKTMDKVTFNGTETWTYSNGRFWTRITGIKQVSANNIKANMICSRYATKTANETYGGQYGISLQANTDQVFVRDSTFTGTTGAAFATYIASNPFDVVYELASPTTFSTTPVSVSSLLGTNNIWANTGDTELEYYPAAASLVAVQNRSSKVYVSIPLGKIRYDTYQATPNQALDLDSFRAETGVLIRTVLSHTATKVEFSTVPMTDDEWQSVWAILSAGFNNSRERKLKLRYYDSMSSSYKAGWFYVPDVQFGTRNVDEANGIINYNEIRIAFIEY